MKTLQYSVAEVKESSVAKERNGAGGVQFLQFGDNFYLICSQNRRSRVRQFVDDRNLILREKGTGRRPAQGNKIFFALPFIIISKRKRNIRLTYRVAHDKSFTSNQLPSTNSSGKLLLSVSETQPREEECWVVEWRLSLGPRLALNETVLDSLLEQPLQACTILIFQSLFADFKVNYKRGILLLRSVVSSQTTTTTTTQTTVTALFIIKIVVAMGNRQ